MALPLPTVHPRLLDTMWRFFPHRVDILRRESTLDEYGQEVDDWQALLTDLPARVVTNGPGTGAGGWSGEVNAPTGTYDVDGRTAVLAGYYPNITTAMEMQLGNEVYQIEAIEHDAEHVTTRLRSRLVS